MVNHKGRLIIAEILIDQIKCLSEMSFVKYQRNLGWLWWVNSEWVFHWIQIGEHDCCWVFIFFPNHSFYKSWRTYSIALTELGNTEYCSTSYFSPLATILYSFHCDQILKEAAWERKRWSLWKPWLKIGVLSKRSGEPWLSANIWPCFCIFNLSHTSQWMIWINRDYRFLYIS